MKVIGKLTIGLLLLCFAAPAFAQDDPEDVIAGFYHRYLRRSPTRAEVRNWDRAVDDGRLTLDDVLANILASREYYDMARGNSARWLRRMSRDLLGRDLGPDEVRNWMRGLDMARGNRLQVAKGFVASAKIANRTRWENRQGDDDDADQDYRSGYRNREDREGHPRRELIRNEHWRHW